MIPFHDECMFAVIDGRCLKCGYVPENEIRNVYEHKDLSYEDRMESAIQT